jgi:hypothetical protein
MGETRVADIVNLRRVRKAKARLQAATAAEANRVAYGISQTERSLARAESERAAERLAGHRRDSDGGTDPPRS